MSIPNFYLPFSAGNIQKQDTRNRLSRFALSALRNWRFEQSEGIRPAEYMAMYRALHVAFKDVITEDWCVIPKGRIISSITAFDALPVSGLAHPMASGMITVGNAGSYMGGTSGAKIDVSIDTSYFGYDDHICGLIVPANGGLTTFSGWYSTDDVTAGTRVAGGARATASGAYVMPANMPIGVAFTDMYQDIRGEYLNYRMHPDGYHFLTDWYVEVPFIDYKDTGSASGCSPSPANTAASWAIWRDVNKWFTYLAFDSTNQIVKPGALVISDMIGNYALQSNVTATTASGSFLIGTITVGTAYTMPMTNQTVGKLIALDTRFPKDALEDVLTYPRSGMPGSQTAGMIKNLYDFAYYCLSIGKGTAPTVEGVHYAIRNGAFGLARIQLHVS